MVFINDGFLLISEIFLLISILLIIWLTVIYTNNNISIGKLLGIQIGIISLSIIFLTFIMYYNINNINYYIFSNNLYSSNIDKTFLYLVLFGIFNIILLSINYIKINSLNVYELFIILLLILIGFISLIFSNDFLSMYIGIELQSLGLYILATLKQNSIYATEAGLKYFILGALSSSLLILGISIIYSFTGLLIFNELKLFIYNINEFYSIIFIGFILILISLFFKIGAVPFHIWLPDVYEGVATIITAFFAVVPKIIIFNLILKILFIIRDYIEIEINNIIIISGLLSILVGSIGAIYQITLKRLLSYSAIGHTGFLLLSNSIINIEGFISFIFYIIIYIAITLNIFAIILQVQQKTFGTSIKYINNLNNIYKNNITLGSSFVIILFTLAGIPPLSGFFSKLYLFIALLLKGYLFIALIAILLSVIGSVYYLKIIRNIIFLKNKKKNYLLHNITSSGAYIIIYILLFNVFFIIIGNNLIYICYNLSLNYLYL